MPKTYIKNTHTVVNVMNTVREYFRLPTYHKSDGDILTWLNTHQFKQLHILLIDGMGAYQLDKFCHSNGFLKKHVANVVDTVYPPTTAAATTAILTGKYPIETGWLGWQQYFKDIDQHLVMFLNRDYYTRETYKESSYAYKTLPVIDLMQDCKQAHIKAKEIFPAFRKDGVHSFQELCERIKVESTIKQYQVIYEYWDAFDDCMHQNGATCQEAASLLQEYDVLLEKLSKQLPSDTGLIILADHGQIDARTVYLKDYEDILECLRVLPSLENRTASFYIKEGYHELFRERFLTHFNDDYILYTKEEALEANLFGIGKSQDRISDLLGDYIACAISNVSLVYDISYTVKGNHSGMTKEEIQIPIILYPKE